MSHHSILGGEMLAGRVGMTYRFLFFRLICDPHINNEFDQLTPSWILKGFLGTAILDHFKNRGSSHLSLLKHLAIPDF